MKKFILFCLIVVCMSIVMSCSNKKSLNPVEMNTVQRYYYMMGNVVAADYAEHYGAEFDKEAFAAGASDYAAGRVIGDGRNEIIDEYNALQYKDNRTAAEEFLAKNEKEEGVIKTKSGLQYKVLREGKGPKPEKTDAVVVDYELTLPDGTVADSSYKRGKSAEFPVANVVPGFAEGVMLMNEGAKYQLWIHPDLGYGKSGAGSIEPETLLTFVVELHTIKKPSWGK